MTSDGDPKKQEAIRDSADVPVVLVDGIYGMTLREGVVQINLSRHVFPAPGSNMGEPFNQVVLRLGLSVMAFDRLTNWMNETRSELRKRGVLKEENDNTSGNAS